MTLTMPVPITTATLSVLKEFEAVDGAFSSVLLDTVTSSPPGGVEAVISSLPGGVEALEVGGVNAPLSVLFTLSL